jgi:hypothetical protein
LALGEASGVVSALIKPLRAGVCMLCVEADRGKPELCAMLGDGGTGFDTIRND